jgi:hypothetical protein
MPIDVQVPTLGQAPSASGRAPRQPHSREQS